MKLRKTRRRGKILWEVDTQSAGQRARRFFASRPEAEAFMGRQMVLDSSLDLAQDWQQIPAADLPDLVRAHRLARQADCRVLDLVKAQLQKGRPAKAGSMALGPAIQQCLEAKRSASCREEYVKNLGLVLRQFAQGREAMPLAQITLEDIEEFMAQGRTAMSRATYLNRLGTLFSFAVRRDWLSTNPCLRIDRPKVDLRPPQILSVRQSARALVWTRRHAPRCLAWLTLALFAG
ncbi:MAG: hypothetical protein ACYDC1_06565, partial [Limisphaerales bacterium]